MGLDEQGDSLVLFQQHQKTLLGLVYRMTGSMQEAEDIVQEVFIRWQQADHAAIDSLRAWLTTVATRLAIDHMKSAQVKRLSYIGPWLPEPFIEEKQTPQSIYELDQSITTALMLVLEKLSPAERASFILHDIFSFSFDEIADIIEKENGSCRKLASRARAKIDGKQVQGETKTQDYLQVTTAFFEAIKSGKIASLVAVLKSEVAFYSDGGGKASAAREILNGVDLVAKFLLNVVGPNLRGEKSDEVALTQTWFNGAPGFLLWLDGLAVTAFSFSVNGGQIESIFALRNPDKLKFFS